MRVRNAIAGFQMLIGAASLAVASWLVVKVDAEGDPHGFIFSGALILGVFGVISILAGFSLTRSVRSMVIGQTVFVAAAALAYIELFTSYAGLVL